MLLQLLGENQVKFAGLALFNEARKNESSPVLAPACKSLLVHLEPVPTEPEYGAAILV
jgi:hypothetical protein